MVDLTKASPRPWKRGQEGNLRIYAKDGMADRSGLIAKVFRADDIALIVEAVNAYTPTREALEAAREALDSVIFWAGTSCPCSDGEPDPCPVCGADAETGVCKASEVLLPEKVRKSIDAALAKIAQEEG